MQKKIIALAVAAVASGAAFAQSNVVISGNLNYHLENASASNPSNAAAAGAAGLLPREGRARLNENASNVNFAVTEDLGSGLRAFAQVQSAITSGQTPGNANALWGQRNTFVGIAGGFGTIQAGRFDVHYNSHGGVDGFQATTAISANSLAILHGVGGRGTVQGPMAGYGLGAGNRLSNAVAYVSPNFSGATITLGYARPGVGSGGVEGVANTSGTTYRKESGWTVALNYGNGPVTAFASYLAHSDVGLGAVGLTFNNNVNGAVAASGLLPTWSGEVRGFRMGGAYTFPMGLKVGMIYDTTKNVARNDAPASGDFNSKRAAWVFPVTYAFGPNTLGFTYGKAGNVTIGGTVANAAAVAGADMNSTGARYLMAGYQYAFSKRTNLGVTFARIDNDARAGYDFWANGAVGMTSALRGADPTSVSIGLRHAF